MKFLYIQDVHIKGVNPINRIGDYYSEVMAKVTEVISLSKKMKVDRVILGGDLYESNKVSDLMVDRLLDEIEEAGIPWDVIWGNHDTEGHNPSLSKSTSLAHMFRRCKLFNHLDSISDNGTFIQGFDHYHNIENDLKENGLMCSDPKAKLKIAVLHAFVTLKPFLPQVTHVVAKDIKTDFNYILLGHYHSSWDIKEVNGVKWINIGCLGRAKVNEAKEEPKVLFVDTNTEKFEIIKLKSAKKGEEVFDLDKAKEIKIYDSNIDEFIKSLEDTKLQEIDLVDLTEYIGKEQKIDAKVTSFLVKLILKFKEEVVK